MSLYILSVNVFTVNLQIKYIPFTFCGRKTFFPMHYQKNKKGFLFEDDYKSPPCLNQKLKCVMLVVGPA